MFSRVLCGRFYKIFVSPMLHKKEDSKSLSFFCAASCAHPPRRRLSGRGKITIFVSTKKQATDGDGGSVFCREAGGVGAV